MTNIDVGATGAKRISYREPNPREVLREIVQANPSASETKIARLFDDAIAGREEDYAAVFREYWVTNTLRTLRKRPPSNPIQPAAVAKLTRKVEQNIQHRAKVLFLELVMPSGKTLRDCTGAECRKFGGWLTKVAAKMKPTQTVGSVFSEAALRKLWGRR